MDLSGEGHFETGGDREGHLVRKVPQVVAHVFTDTGRGIELAGGKDRARDDLGVDRDGVKPNVEVEVKGVEGEFRGGQRAGSTRSTEAGEEAMETKAGSDGERIWRGEASGRPSFGAEDFPEVIIFGSIPPLTRDTHASSQLRCRKQREYGFEQLCR